MEARNREASSKKDEVADVVKMAGIWYGINRSSTRVVCMRATVADRDGWLQEERRYQISVKFRAAAGSLAWRLAFLYQ